MYPVAEPKINFNVLSPISMENHRNIIKKMLDDGFSTVKIEKSSNYTRTQINRVKKKLKERKSLRNSKPGGGKLALNAKKVKKFNSIIVKNSKASFSQLTHIYNKGKKAEDKISRSTVQNLYKKGGFRKRKAIKRPILTKKQIDARLKFARDMRDINTDVVVYTDEKWFFACRRDQWVSTGEGIDDSILYQQAPSHWQKIMYLAVVTKDTPSGKIGLYEVEGTMDKFTYLDFMKRAVGVLRRHSIHDNHILIHDGAPIHVARDIQEELQRMFSLGVIKQSPNSPDFNALDCGLFGILERKVNGESPVSLEDLRSAVRKAWKDLAPSDVKNCIDHAFNNMRKAAQKKGSNQF